MGKEKDSVKFRRYAENKRTFAAQARLEQTLNKIIEESYKASAEEWDKRAAEAEARI